jgi:hypothetical protein
MHSSESISDGQDTTAWPIACLEYRHPATTPFQFERGGKPCQPGTNN